MNNYKIAKLTGLIIVITVLILIGMAYFTFWDNHSWWDTTYHFDTVQIAMPDGSTVTGKVQSWLDWENSDAVQVKIDGIVYYTHLSNVVLMAR